MYAPTVQSNRDGSTATFIQPAITSGRSVIENECGDQFTWANDEFTFIDLDTEQVKELVFNGFGRESAAAAVAESHGYYREGKYADDLLNALRGQRLDGESEEDFDTSHEGSN